MSRSNTLFKKTSNLILAAAIVFLLVFTAGCAANGLTNRNDQNKPSAGVNPTGNAGNPTGPANPTGNAGSPTSAGNPTNPANPTGNAGSPTNAGNPTNTPTSTTDPTGAATPTGEPLVTGEPSPTTPPKKTAEELKKEYGQATVTDITGSTRTDFAFTEDYEGFYDKSKSWTLDLNGNTVVITKTIVLKSQLTITNGRIIIACEPGFRLDPEASSVRLEFSGKKIGALSISVIGGVAVYTNRQVWIRACEIEVNGGAFVIPDTKSAWNNGDKSTFSTGRMENTKITVFDGCFLLNRDPLAHVGTDISKCGLYVYENGIGIDNSGDLSVSGFTAIPKEDIPQSQIIGGCFVYNRAGGKLSLQSSAYVESGTGVLNEGEITGSIGVIVETGTAVLNKGYIKASLDVSTVPMSLFKGALVINEAGAELETYGFATVYTGENAVALDNSGTCSMDGNIMVGVPSFKDNSLYTSSSMIMYFRDLFESFFKGGINSVTGCRGFVNRPEAKFASSQLNCHVHASGVTGQKYTDKTVGFFNMTGAHANVSYFTFYIHGEDAIGLLNATGAELTDAYGAHSVRVIAEPFDREIGSDKELEQCFAAIEDDSKLAKDCIGVVNESDISEMFMTDITMCGKGCVGLVNTGHIGSMEMSNMSSNGNGYTQKIKMYGKNNIGVQNSGRLSCDAEKKLFMKVDSTVYGDGNKAVENAGELGVQSIIAICDGTGSVALSNGGNLIVRNEGRFSWNPSKSREGVIPEKCVLIENTGSISEIRSVAGLNFDTGYSSKECTVIKNGANGTITTVSELYAKSRCAVFIDNAGSIVTKRVGAEAPVYEDGELAQARLLVRNSGTIEAGDMQFYTKATDVTVFENDGTIVVQEDVDMEFGDGCENSLPGRNDGRIEVNEIEIDFTGMESGEFTGNGKLAFKKYSYIDRKRNYSMAYPVEGGYVEVLITYDPATGDTTGGSSTSVDASGKVTRLKYVFDKKRAGWYWVDA